MKIELTEDEVIQIGERRYWNSQPWYKILFPPLNRKPFAAGRRFLEEQKRIEQTFIIEPEDKEV